MTISFAEKAMSLPDIGAMRRGNPDGVLNRRLERSLPLKLFRRASVAGRTDCTFPTGKRR
jgi:hypothetical protein